jgi:hypothetical protein
MQKRKQPLEPVNVVEVIAFALITLFFASMIVLAVVTGQALLAVVGGLLVALGGYQLAQFWQRGIRPPTRFERFRLWMSIRPFLLVSIGIPLLIGLSQRISQIGLDRNAASILFLVIIGGWILLMIYVFWRAPHGTRFFRESDAAYKQRVGYREPEL